jgi:hypothetical protein
MAVAVKAGVLPGPGSKPSFEPTTPQPLFETHLVARGWGSVFQYDVSSDGKRFLLGTEPGMSPHPPLSVVVNWDAGLKK